MFSNYTKAYSYFVCFPDVITHLTTVSLFGRSNTHKLNTESEHTCSLVAICAELSSRWSSESDVCRTNVSGSPEQVMLIECYVYLVISSCLNKPRARNWQKWNLGNCLWSKQKISPVSLCWLIRGCPKFLFMSSTCEGHTSLSRWLAHWQINWHIVHWITLSWCHNLSLSFFLPVCLPVCLPACLSACLSGPLPFCLSNDG